MANEIVLTDKAPKPIGPYNQALKTAGGWVFTSGQIPLDPATGKLVSEDIQEQTRQVFANASAVLDAAGSSLAEVVKVTVFLRDMSDFPAVNEVYAEFFSESTAPARSTVQVARLPLDVGVEIEMIAAG